MWIRMCAPVTTVEGVVHLRVCAVSSPTSRFPFRTSPQNARCKILSRT